MNSIRFFKRAKVTSRIFYPRYYTLFSNAKQNVQCYINLCRIVNRPSYFNISFESMKCISNCSSMQTKDSDSSSEKSDDDNVQKILEDEEFQSILKDFANDFGVDSKTNELLDDIRKNIDEDHEKSNRSESKLSTNTPILGGGLHHKYKEFSDADSTVIQSYEEDDDAFYHIDQELKPKSPYNNLKRGITGVFDLEEIIQVLYNESLLDVTAISIPKELHYADFLVLVTAKSERHSDAVSESIKKIYKQKKNIKDPFIKIEGEDVPEWKVMDMGNIVLHIFLEETRALYDIESLWLLDSKYDSGGNSQLDPILNVMEEQMEFFNSLQQSNSTELPKNTS